MSLNQAIITAGGLGTRFKPLTEKIPKEMLPVNRKPLILSAIEELCACGISEITIVLSPNKDVIREYLKGNTPSKAGLNYVIQHESLGLGHAISLTETVIGDEPFVLVLPDDMFDSPVENLKEMISIHARYSDPVIYVGRVPDEEVTRYGIIEREYLGERIHNVKSLMEKPPVDKAPSNLAVFGRYVLPPDIFSVLQETPPGNNNEIQLTDALNILAGQRRIIGYEFMGKRYDCGTLESWIETNIAFGVPREEITRFIDNPLGDR